MPPPTLAPDMSKEPTLAQKLMASDFTRETEVTHTTDLPQLEKLEAVWPTHNSSSGTETECITQEDIAAYMNKITMQGLLDPNSPPPGAEDRDRYIERVCESAYCTTIEYLRNYINCNLTAQYLEATDQAKSRGLDLSNIFHGTSPEDINKLKALLAEMEKSHQTTSPPDHPTPNVPTALFEHPPKFDGTGDFYVWKRLVEDKLEHDNFPSVSSKKAYIFSRLAGDLQSHVWSNIKEYEEGHTCSRLFELIGILGGAYLVG
jgi:hypothetical protein